MPPIDQKLILIVDDDPHIAYVFNRAFEGQDLLIVDIATKVETALDKIKVIFYDLIFLDMNIEGYRYGGMKVLEELRKQEIKLAAEGTPLSTVVIIMSGSICLNDIAQEAHGLDVFHFIDKPIPMTEEFVRRVVNRFGIPLLPRRRPEWPSLESGS